MLNDHVRSVDAKDYISRVLFEERPKRDHELDDELKKIYEKHGRREVKFKCLAGINFLFFTTDCSWTLKFDLSKRCHIWCFIISRLGVKYRPY